MSNRNSLQKTYYGIGFASIYRSFTGTHKIIHLLNCLLTRIAESAFLVMLRFLKCNFYQLLDVYQI